MIKNDRPMKGKKKKKKGKAALSADRRKSLEKGGIYFWIKENGSNLSVGERQLVCFCRAILRKNKIIMLDEATASIDIITEQQIQKLITEEFKDSTVLTIAHRLNTIINSDKVLVVDQGQCAEYDSPQNLLKNKKSHFSKLLDDLKRKK